MSSRATRKARITYFTYTALAAFLRRAPESIAQRVAAVVALAMVRRQGMATRMRTAHLRRVLRDSTGSEPDAKLLKQLTRQAYRAYARYWVEGARLPVASPELVRERMWIASGFDHLAAGMAAGAGVVMALPHIGSWEWGGSFLNGAGFHMTAVAERLEPEKLYEWFIGQRSAMGISIVPLDAEAGGALIKTLRNGGLVGLLCDRDLVGNGIEVEFFGETTTLPAGPATLALRTGAMLITSAVYSGPGINHHAVISAPIDTSRTGSLRTDVARITQEIARHFEEYIRQAPEQWHMFQPNWPSDRAAEQARELG
jgi:phosphatidylinositol dimannoside acyltransferase